MGKVLVMVALNVWFLPNFPKALSSTLIIAEHETLPSTPLFKQTLVALYSEQPATLTLTVGRGEKNIWEGTTLNKLFPTDQRVTTSLKHTSSVWKTENPAELVLMDINWKIFGIWRQSLVVIKFWASMYIVAMTFPVGI